MAPPGLNRTIILSLGLLALCGCSGEPADQPTVQDETVAVGRGPLRIVLREGGTVEAADSVIIRNLAYGKRPIIELVPEGSIVTPGQIVCRLESKDLEEAEVEYQRAADEARSALRQAQQTHAIREKQNLEELEKARTRVALARSARKAYSEGTVPFERRQLRSTLMLAREDLERALANHESARRLFALDIVPKTNVEAEGLGARKATERLAVAERSLTHFETFTRKEEIKKLEADLAVAEISFERIQQECASRIAQTQELVETRSENLADRMEILRRVQRHIANCTVHSPAAGMVVYARRRGWSKEYPISLGKWMRQDEPLLLIPNLSDMTVELDVHESQIENVVPGLPVSVTVDAFANQRLTAEVKYVAPVPSSESSWHNPDYRAYRVDIALLRTIDGVRPGMHAEIEILVRDDRDVLQIPIESVVQSGPRSFVYLPGDDGVELREIEAGDHTESVVEVLAGLTEGDEIFQRPPADAPAPPEARDRPFLPAATEN